MAPKFTLSQKKRKAPPKGLLQFGELGNEETEAAYKHNNEKCTFLAEIPPEVRVKIYRLAFGAAVHVRVTSTGRYPKAKPRLQHRTCQVVDKPEANPKEYAAHHAKCLDFASETKAALPLSLLQTCRKVYKEAEALPYREMSYIVDMGAFTVFVRNLHNARKVDLKQMTLFNAGDYFSQGTITVGEVKDLVSVECIRFVLLGISPWHDLDELNKLAPLPLKDVQFVAYPSERNGAASGGKTHEERLQAEVERVKQKLLRSREEVEIEATEHKAAARASAADKRDVDRELDEGAQVQRRAKRARLGLRTLA